MNVPKPSKVTQDQWVKVVKAAGYSFVSTFVTTLLVVPDLTQIDQRAVVSALVAATNSVLVLVKQLFTKA